MRRLARYHIPLVIGGVDGVSGDLLIHRVFLRSALFLVFVLGAVASCSPWSRHERPHDGKKGNSLEMNPVEIVPGKSIGELRLGARVETLPPRATISGAAGALDGVQFFAPDGAVDDIWIEDLRKFPGEVHFAGKVIPRQAPLAEIKKMFGSCHKVSGVKGGVFFNCDAGVTLGCDFEETGKFIQIRLKPR